MLEQLGDHSGQKVKSQGHLSFLHTGSNHEKHAIVAGSHCAVLYSIPYSINGKIFTVLFSSILYISIQGSVIHHCPPSPLLFSEMPQNVINRPCYTMKLYILSNVGITECHPNVNAVYHSEALSPWIPLPFASLPFFLTVASLHSCSSSPRSLYCLSPVSSLCLYSFSPLKNYNGDRVFTSLRLICDTQLCQLKPLMAQCSIQRCQSCQPWNITVCCINRLVKEQGCKCMKFKGKYGGKDRRDEKAGGLNLAWSMSFWHISGIIVMDHSLYRKKGDSSETNSDL